MLHRNAMFYHNASQTAESRVVVVPCADGYSRKAWADMQFSCFCKVSNPYPNRTPTYPQP